MKQLQEQNQNQSAKILELNTELKTAGTEKDKASREKINQLDQKQKQIAQGLEDYTKLMQKNKVLEGQILELVDSNCDLLQQAELHQRAITELTELRQKAITELTDPEYEHAVWLANDNARKLSEANELNELERMKRSEACEKLAELELTLAQLYEQYVIFERQVLRNMDGYMTNYLGSMGGEPEPVDDEPGDETEPGIVRFTKWQCRKVSKITGRMCGHYSFKQKTKSKRWNCDECKTNRHSHWLEVDLEVDPPAPAPIVPNVPSVARGKVFVEAPFSLQFKLLRKRARNEPNVLVTENQFHRKFAEDTAAVEGGSTEDVMDKLKKLMETWNTHTRNASSADVTPACKQLARELDDGEIEVSFIGRRSAQEHEKQPFCYQHQFAKLPKLLGYVAEYFGLDLSAFTVALYAYHGSANWDKIEIQEHRLDMERQVGEIIQAILRGPSRLVVFASPDRFSRCPEWAVYLWDTFTRSGLMIMVLEGNTLLKERREIVTSVMRYDLQRMNAMIQTAIKRGG